MEEAIRGRIVVKNYLILALWLVLAVVQAVIPARTWFFLLATLTGLVVMCYLWTREMRDKASLDRQVHKGIVQVGDVLEERFTLVNDSILPVLWAEIEDRSTLPGYNANRVESVGPKDDRRWRHRGICLRRGLFELGPSQVRLGDPFGIFSTTLSYPALTSFLVYPPIVALPQVEVPRGRVPGSSRSSLRAQHITTTAAGIREYAPGDSLNRIHWLSTARRDELFAKEFDLEPSGNLWVVLDLEKRVQAGQDEESTLEYGIILAASLAGRLLREEREVGLVISDAQRSALPLDKGHNHLWRIMERLALVSELGDTPVGLLLESLTRQLRWGSSIVVITSSCDPEWVGSLVRLSRRGMVPMAILLDPATFGGEGDVEAVKRVLKEEGVNSYLIGRGYAFQYLWPEGGPRRLTYRTLATGRVIPILSAPVEA